MALISFFVAKNDCFMNSQVLILLSVTVITAMIVITLHRRNVNDFIAALFPEKFLARIRWIKAGICLIKKSSLSI